MCVWVRPKPHIHKECGLRFPILLIFYTMDCPAALVGEGVSQGVMSSEEASYNPGLSPIKGQKFSLGTLTRSRDKFSSSSLGTIKASPSCRVG
jgi:hypothetical protein